MICKFCGNEIDDNSDFCFICGQKVEAQTAPAAEVNDTADDVYAQPRQPEAPVAVAQQPAVQAPVAPEQNGTKKGKKVKDPSVAGKAAKFFSFLFVLIGLILYASAVKKGYDKKATSILNSIMTGLCVKMAIINLILAKKYLLG